MYAHYNPKYEILAKERSILKGLLPCIAFLIGCQMREVRTSAAASHVGGWVALIGPVQCSRHQMNGGRSYKGKNAPAQLKSLPGPGWLFGVWQEGRHARADVGGGWHQLGRCTNAPGAPSTICTTCIQAPTDLQSYPSYATNDCCN